MKDRYLLTFKLIMFISAGSGGIFASFINLHLEQTVGLTGTEIGLITFLSLILIVFIKPIIGYIGDKTGQYAFIIQLALIASVAVSIFYYQSRTFGMVLIAALLLRLTGAPVVPFTDLLVTNYCDKIKYDFGKVRVFVSLGWLLFTVIAGFLISGMSLPWFNGETLYLTGFLSIQLAIFGSSVVASIITFMLMFFVPKPDITAKTKKEKQKVTTADVKRLLTNKPFLFILVFNMMSLIVVEAAKMYVGNHLVMELGAPESILSWMMLVQVTPELILLPLGIVLLRKFGFKNWYIFSVTTMIIRLAVYSFTTNLTLFVLLSALHAIGVYTQVAGNISFIRKVVPLNMMGLAFTLVASVSATSSAVLSLVFGFVYEHLGGFTVFKITTAILITTLILVVSNQSLNEVGNEIIDESMLAA